MLGLFYAGIRNKEVTDENAFQCLLCGRCKQVCPVGINTTGIRVSQRRLFSEEYKTDFNYINATKSLTTDILYFAGCMGHLTPGVSEAMKFIFNKAGLNYRFMDEDGSICCGRPLLLTGDSNGAKQLMEKNKEIINRSGAKYLVTSCPTCYKVFSEDYNLPVKVLHHTQFLNFLIKSKRIELAAIQQTAVYHDPCELGRGSGIYEEPREVLENIVKLINTDDQKEHSLCCGGSLGNLLISMDNRNAIIKQAYNTLTVNNPELLVTSCPLCKKTFSKVAGIQVSDIAELVAKSIHNYQKAIIRIPEPQKEKDTVLHAGIISYAK